MPVDHRRRAGRARAGRPRVGGAQGRRARAGLLAAVLCAVLAATSGCAGGQRPRADATDASASSPPVATATGSTARRSPSAGEPSPTATGPAPSTAEPSGDVPRHETVSAARRRATVARPFAAVPAGVHRLLVRRASAVGDGDRRAWLGTLAADAGPDLRSAQADAFDHLRELPVRGFRYTSAQPTGAVEGPSGSDRTLPDRRALRVRVGGRFSLSGGWTGSRTFRQLLTVQRDGAAEGGWRVVAVADGPGVRQIWQLPGLRVRHEEHALVLGNVDRERLRDYARLSDEAVTDVASHWAGWDGPVVVTLPRNRADFESLSGLDGPHEGGGVDVAAVTVGPLVTGEPARADLVVVNPAAYAELEPSGRRVVVLHEVAHVATRATTTREVPPWLSEGYAEYVAWSRVRLPTASVAPDLLRDARAGRPPTSLPARHAFDGSDAEATRAYHEAWLFCAYLAERFGEEGLVAFYRTAAGPGSGGAGTRARAAARSVFGVGLDRLVAGWRGWLGRSAGSAA